MNRDWERLLKREGLGKIGLIPRGDPEEEAELLFGDDVIEDDYSEESEP